MNNFLILVIILMGGAGIYEYTILQQQLQHAESEELLGLNGQSSKLDNLQTQIRKDDAENVRLTGELQNAHAKIADLTAELQGAKKSVEDMRLAALAAADAGKNPGQAQSAPRPAPPAPPPVIKLGTIVALDGKTYQDCQLLKVEADGITFSHSTGITKVMYRFLPLELQKRFGHHDQMPDADAAPAN